MSDKNLPPSPRATQPGSETASHNMKPARGHWIALVLVVLILTPMAIWPALDTFRPVNRVYVARALPTVNLVSQTPGPGEDAGASINPTRTVQAPGWIEPDPYYTAVSALADGVVEKIHVLEGETVQSGQLLAELVSEDAELQLRQAEARAATMEAALARARAAYIAAKTDWDEPVERDREVASTTASFVEAQAELERLPAEVRAKEADLQRWREEHKRVLQAYEQGAATTRERLVAEYELSSSEAGLEALQLRSKVLKARVERLEAEAIAAVRAADLRVTDRLALDLAAAAVSDAQAALEHAHAQRDEVKLRLARMTIVSPMDGNILKRLKSPGDKVMLGMDDPYSSHIVHLYDPKRLQVRVDVPLADASQIRIGQACEVVVDVLPDRVFAGEVTRITHEADLQKNTLQVKVRVLEPADILKPEMLTRVRFMGDDAAATTFMKDSEITPNDESVVIEGRAIIPSRVRIPEGCLDGSRVWVVRDRRGLTGRVVAVGVRALDREGGFVAVQGALSVGDLVVQQPDHLSPGERVEVAVEAGGVV